MYFEHILTDSTVKNSRGKRKMKKLHSVFQRFACVVRQKNTKSNDDTSRETDPMKDADLSDEEGELSNFSLLSKETKKPETTKH